MNPGINQILEMPRLNLQVYLLLSVILEEGQAGDVDSAGELLGLRHCES